MARPTEPISAPTTEPPVFVGGDPSLDLVNTVDWRSDGPANERLSSYDRFVRWAEGAGVTTRAQSADLRRRAEAFPAEATAALDATRRLRVELKRLFHEVASGHPSPEACAALDARLAPALSQLGVAPSPPNGSGDGVLRWRWRDVDEHLDWPLWPVVWSAAKLLTSAESDRIRVCAGPDCGWVYVDRSRNGLRRWCEMRTCGTAAKSERRRRKQRARD